jgi:hypothetical protein
VPFVTRLIPPEAPLPIVDRYVADPFPLLGPRGMPLLADLDLPRLGSPRRGFPLVTRTLLFAAQEGRVTAVRPPKDQAWARIFTWAIEGPSLELIALILP